MAEAKVEQEKLIAEAWAEQLLRQDQLMVEMDASRANNEELHKANEELRKNLQQLDQHSIVERGPSAQPRARPKPFTQAIMDALVPVSYITPKIILTGVEDPESHLTAFNAHMIILGGCWYFSRQLYRINCNIVLFKVRMSNPQRTILIKIICYKTH